MPTLSELAKTQQQTQVAQAPAGAAQAAGAPRIGRTVISPTKRIDKSAELIRDIGKVFGKGIETQVQASDYTGKRVGTDLLVQYKRDMGAIALKYADKPDLSSSDMVEKTRLEQGVYEKYMQKGAFGDNDIANEAFKETYAVPATDNLFRLKEANARTRVKLFQQETTRDISEAVNILGSDINEDVINTFKDQYSEAGLQPLLVDELVLNTASDSISNEVNDNHELYYDAGGNINQAAIDGLIQRHYQHYLESDNETIKAEVAKNSKSVNKFLEAKADDTRATYNTQAMNIGRALTWEGDPYTDANGVTYKFANNFKEYESLIDAQFPLLTTEAKTKVMNLYKEKTATKNAMNSLATNFMASTKYNFIDKKFPSGQPISLAEVQLVRDQNVVIQNLKDQGLISDSKGISADFRTKEIERQYYSQQTIFSDIANQSTEKLIEYSEKGSTNANGDVITGNEYMKQYKISEDNIALDIDGMDIDVNNADVHNNLRADLYSRFDSSVRMATAQGKARPALFNRYDTVVNDVSGSTKDLGTMQKIVEYIDYTKANGNNKYFAYDRDLNNLKQALYQVDADGNLLPQETRARNASIIMQNMATNIYRNSNNKEAVRTATKAVDEIALGGGEGLRGTLTFIDTPVPNATAQHVMRLYQGSLDTLSIRQHVSSYETWDAGGTLGFDRQRVFVPKGLTSAKFGNYVDTILKIYNEDREDTLNAGDVEYVIGNDGVDLTYRLLDKTTTPQRHIGNISAQGYQFLLGTGAMSEEDSRTTEDIFKRKQESLFLGD